MGIQEIVSKHREQILSLAEKYGASDVRVFGSFARGTADEKSDVDFLVNLAPGRSFFKPGVLHHIQILGEAASRIFLLSGICGND